MRKASSSWYKSKLNLIGDQVMTNNSVNEFYPLIKEGIESLLMQKENLSDIENLANVSLGNTFLDLPKVTIHGHLGVLHDFLEKSITLNDSSINLFKNVVNKLHKG
jgi:hypothetical protein